MGASFCFDDMHWCFSCTLILCILCAFIFEMILLRKALIDVMVQFKGMGILTWLLSHYTYTYVYCLSQRIFWFQIIFKFFLLLQKLSEDKMQGMHLLKKLHKPKERALLEGSLDECKHSKGRLEGLIQCISVCIGMTITGNNQCFTGRSITSSKR